MWLWRAGGFFVRRAIRNGYWDLLGRPDGPGREFDQPRPFITFVLRPEWNLEWPFPNLVQERMRRYIFGERW